LLDILLPVFGLVAVGYFAAWFGLLNPEADARLSDFVFIICLPILIFKTVATAVLPDVQPWGYWISYFLGVAIVWAIASWAGKRWFRCGQTESVVAGFASGQSNTIFIGIPLILKAYGDAASVPLFLLIAIHLPVTMTVAAILMERGNGVSIKTLLRRLILNPIVQGLLIGVAWRVIGLPFGGPFKTVADDLAGAGVTCALFAMGLSLYRYNLLGDLKLASLITVLKIVAHPSLVWLFAFEIFPMPTVWSGVAVLFAAMPTGVNSYLLAERNQAGVAAVSSAIAMSTCLSLFTSAFWLWALKVA
jgi:malonate transporter and related proteins